MANVPTAVKNIIIINALVMVMTALNKTFMYETFALFYPTSPFFHWWQPVTHMFMHGGFWHLFFNMYTLYIFGSVPAALASMHSYRNATLAVGMARTDNGHRETMFAILLHKKFLT